jgi:hypothetical protein
MTEQIKTMLESVAEDNLSESTETFKTILADKIKDRLQEEKEVVAKTIFAEEYKESNPKIDLYHKETGAYLTSTNHSPTVKHAVAGYETKYPDMVGLCKGSKAKD